jgi:hypothetical protein
VNTLTGLHSIFIMKRVSSYMTGMTERLRKMTSLFHSITFTCIPTEIPIISISTFPSLVLCIHDFPLTVDIHDVPLTFHVVDLLVICSR